MSCEHLWGDCADIPEWSIVPIMFMDHRWICCLKCGHKDRVLKWERWETIKHSWRANDLDIEAWEDVDDTCAIKPCIDKL